MTLLWYTVRTSVPLFSSYQPDTETAKLSWNLMDIFVTTLRVGLIIIFFIILAWSISNALKDYNEGPIGTRDSESFVENGFFPAVTICPYKKPSESQSITTYDLPNNTFKSALKDAAKPLILESVFLPW